MRQGNIRPVNGKDALAKVRNSQHAHTILPKDFSRSFIVHLIHVGRPWGQ